MSCNVYRQRGATLLVSLIMLVVLTLFAVAGFNLSSINLKVAGNFQQQRLLEASVSQALEQVISTLAPFTVPATQTITVNGVSVATTAAACYHSSVAIGFESNTTTLSKPWDNVWEITATGSDTLTGAQATVTQGVRIRQREKSCILNGVTY